jgi:transcriptional regulator with PAS, ATPase and Fis domain
LDGEEMTTMFTKDELLYYLEQVQGLMVIDIDGKLVYMNQQCADYIDVDLKSSMGKNVLEVFPGTKMMDIIWENKPITTEFYVTELEGYSRISWSTRLPLMKDGKLIGAMEYDLFEDVDGMNVFVQQYSKLNEEIRSLQEEVEYLRNTKYTISNIIGESSEMHKLREQVRHAAKTNSTVIIQGETGTGKELAAHSIHHLSKRSRHNFIKVNAASLPESLIESELFGYEGGAFTGANKDGKKGKFEFANGGTIFIDEIGQMPLHLQPKLLRVLQEREIERLGGERSIPVDVRVIAATNTDLKEMVNKDKFREDLYYRLNVMEIKMVPLRDIKSDIPVISYELVHKFNKSMGKGVETIDEKVMEKLKTHQWPGNMRELHNCIETAMSYAEGDTLKAEHFRFSPLDITSITSLSAFSAKDNPIEEVKKKAEINIIMQALEECGGNKTKAAELLKIPRTLFHQKLARLGIHTKK